MIFWTQIENAENENEVRNNICSMLKNKTLDVLIYSQSNMNILGIFHSPLEYCSKEPWALKWSRSQSSEDRCLLSIQKTYIWKLMTSRPGKKSMWEKVGRFL